jgi:hypothetical protein
VRPLDRPTLRKFIEEAADALTGDWIIIGGTVLPLLGAGDRVTLDIDFIPVGDASQSDLLQLMEIAEGLQLPIETVNQAGAYFLQKISDYREHLVLLHEGAKARVFRPDPTLYISLKTPRLSETDLEDCLSFLEFARRSGESWDRARLSRSIQSEIRQAESAGRRERLGKLLQVIAQ